jgi:hypothetical protein
MQANSPVSGPGYLRWNAGGWFGSQLGGTCWLLVGAVVLAPRAPGVAAVWLAGFVVANAIGSWLWRRRDRLRPYPALQLLLLACGLSGLPAWLAVNALRPDLAGLMGWPRRGYLVLLIVPALMAWPAVLEHAGRRRSESPDGA